MEAEDSSLETPAAAELAFYAAFRDLDGDRMRSVWAIATDIFCIHPGGPLLTGPDAVLGSWREIFASADPPHLEYKVLHRHQEAGIAIHLVEEQIRPSGSKEGGEAVVFATNVYRFTDGGWRLFSHHASTPLVRLRKPKAERRVH